MKKKLISIFLALALAVCAFPVSAFAAVNPGTIASPMVGTVVDNHYVLSINTQEYRVPLNTVLSYTNPGPNTKNDYVKIGQMALNCAYGRNPNAQCYVGNPDGYFGLQTHTGTVAFQEFWHTVMYSSTNLDLEADGIIGNKTWRALSNYCL